MHKNQCPQTLTHGWQKVKGHGITPLLPWILEEVKPKMIKGYIPKQ
jgi:hypothetical protein